MSFKSVQEIAKIWGISERSVRNYCRQGRVYGAVLQGKTWKIPADTVKPDRAKKGTSPLLLRLNQEREKKIKGGIYHKIQIELTYNSNHMEGSRLTHDQTRYIYETNSMNATDEVIKIDDIIETKNHFKCIDYVLAKATEPLNENLILKLHKILKTGTSDSELDWFAVGAYKKLPNEVGGHETTPPQQVSDELKKLLIQYNNKKEKNLEDIIDFHVKFERIHPFQDGNGRVGRLIIFKECLNYGIVPFIIQDDLKLFYYRGISQWGKENGYLMDTCLTGQDRFIKYLDYYKISY